MPSPTRYARNGDVHIAFHTHGDGPIDVLYVPQSFSVAEQLWEHPRVARFFDRLGSFSRLILFDRRESGMSDRLGRAPTLEEQMDDVVAVMDAAGSERAAMVAMLEGGPMATLFAATHPERTGALVLYATFARTTAAPGYEWGSSPEDRRARMEALRENWGSGALIETFAPSVADDPVLRAWLGRLQRLAMSPGTAFAVASMNGELDLRPILGSVRVPTLVLHRRDDEAMNFRHSEFIASQIPGARLKVLEGRDNFPFVGDSEAVVGEIEEFLTGARTALDRDRVVATVLLTDICGSTEMAAHLGDERWRDVLAEHHASVRRTVAAFQGRHVKSTGDGVLASFTGPARAIRAARAMVEDARGLGLDLRVGLHTGEVELLGDDIGGMAVHITARVMDEAAPGEVLASSTVRDLVVGSGLAFQDRGTRALRGVPGEWRLFAVGA